MTDHTDRWAAVGRSIDARRRELGLTKAELARSSGVSDVTIAGYVGGAPIVREDKARGLLAALGWPPDAFDRIAAGEDLTRYDAAPSDALEQLAELRARVERLERRLDTLGADPDDLGLAARSDRPVDEAKAGELTRARKRTKPSPAIGEE